MSRNREAPGAAPADTDAETGPPEADTAGDLYALDSMYRRGLIDAATYRQRRADLTGRDDGAV